MYLVLAFSMKRQQSSTSRLADFDKESAAAEKDAVIHSAISGWMVGRVRYEPNTEQPRVDVGMRVIGRRTILYKTG